MTQGTTIEKYIADFGALIAKPASYEKPETFSDTLLAMVLLSGLAPSYSTPIDLKMSAAKDEEWKALATQARQHTSFHGEVKIPAESAEAASSTEPSEEWKQKIRRKFQDELHLSNSDCDKLRRK